MDLDDFELDIPRSDSPDFDLGVAETEWFDLEGEADYTDSPQRKRRQPKENGAVGKRASKKQRRASTATGGDGTKTAGAPRASSNAKLPTVTPTITVAGLGNETTHRTAEDEADNLFSWDDPDWRDESQRGIVADEAVDAVDEDVNYLRFLDAVSADEDMIIRISGEVFVVLGWTTEASTMYYHLSRIRVGTDVRVTCLCPMARRKRQCFHERFLLECSRDIWPWDEASENGGNNKICMFLRGEGVTENIIEGTFSVPLPWLEKTIRNRAIVTYVGADNGDGEWKCQKDSSGMKCAHIPLARRLLRKLKYMDVEPDDDGDVDEVFVRDGAPRKTTTGKRGNAASVRAVSYLPRELPVWALLKADRGAFKPAPLRQPPALFTLNQDSTCNCAEVRCKYNPCLPIITKKCTVFTLSEAWTECDIELQLCSLCKRRFIGPDCRELGIFNWNNSMLFTEELLDEYTSQYTTSETPFISFVIAVARRYESARSKANFASDATFRGVWFAYAVLLRLENDMLCPKCGTDPETIICDGVTLAYHKKHILDSIRPPSTILSGAITKDNQRPIPNVQPLTNRELRKDIRFVLTGALKKPDASTMPTATTRRQDHESANTSDEHGREERLKEERLREEKLAVQTNAWATRVAMIPGVGRRLAVENVHLSKLWTHHFGQVEVAGRFWSTAEVYVKLFQQIAQEENILQLLCPAEFDSLREFIQRPCWESASRLRRIPCLYNVVMMELRLPSNAQIGGVSAEVLGICRWMYKRAYTELGMMRNYGVPGVEVLPQEDYLSTGACYGRPEIRKRPKYPRFTNETGRDNPKLEMRGEGCNKFYSEYGERRLTGGLMILWCTHSICYGFHCIPSAEGRNDVFSAILTRWEKAPKVLVYDFACALQPYCMAREPEFFAETLFVIDSFHAKGHTKCGHSAFLKTYAETDPTLVPINTSAAECGNSGITRIRKAVSYMSQARAILYTRVFLSVWNRGQIRKLEM